MTSSHKPDAGGRPVPRARRGRTPVAAVFAEALEGSAAARTELLELAHYSDAAVEAFAALVGVEVERERRELDGPPAWEVASCDQAIAALRVQCAKGLPACRASR